MATVKISLGSAMGGGAPVPATIPRVAETLAGNGTTTATAESGDYITVTAILGNVHVAIGQAPSAGATTGYAITTGGTMTYGPAAAGDKVAITEIV